MSTKENLGMTLQQLKYLSRLLRLVILHMLHNVFILHSQRLADRFRCWNRNWVTVCLTAIVSL